MRWPFTSVRVAKGLIRDAEIHHLRRFQQDRGGGDTGGFFNHGAVDGD
jgi:hypothetical protein